MRPLLLAFALCCSTLCFAQGNGIKTEAAFIAAFKTAITEKSPDKIDKLLYKVGMSDWDKAQSAQAEKMGFEFQAGQLKSISLAPLEGKRPTMVFEGKKLEPTFPPAGLVKMEFASADSKSTDTREYAIIKGEYWLVGSKSVDLGWKGAPDKPLSLQISGPGKDRLKVTMKYNASGVDLVEESEEESSALRGQHFIEITATSADPNAKLILTVKEGETEVYRTEARQAGKTVEYRRK